MVNYSIIRLDMNGHGNATIAQRLGFHLNSEKAENIQPPNPQNSFS